MQNSSLAQWHKDALAHAPALPSFAYANGFDKHRKVFNVMIVSMMTHKRELR
jgi:hypothetical protein